VSTVLEPRILSIGENLNDLRKMAHDPEAYANEINNAFGWIVDAIWAISPSDFPERFLKELDNMPNGMRERFDDAGLELPESAEPQAGWHIRWVIAPEIK
jgi:hypothetical protein